MPIFLALWASNQSPRRTEMHCGYFHRSLAGAATALACLAAGFLGIPAPAALAQQIRHAVWRTPETEQATQYQFSEEDGALLDKIQRGCFRYFWEEVGAPSGLAKDRRSTDVASIAGIGFQLSALPIGVERGWITREQGEQRALSILRTLTQRDDNRYQGVYLHFVQSHDAGVSPAALRNEASTLDHALLLAGAAPAASYFGGEVAELVDRMIDQTNWQAFLSPQGFISFGWQPADNRNMKGDGALISADWHVASDEERLLYFVAAGSPAPERAVPPTAYYRLHRSVEGHGDLPPHAVSPTGALFTYFFSHMWIDYRRLSADDPQRFGVDAPPIDWFENSRRAVLTHRQRCIEVAHQYTTFSHDRWGVSPCMGYDETGESAYLVQDVTPNLSKRDEWRRGTVAPYAAGCAIVFAPQESLAALRAFRELKNRAGEPLVWRDPDQGGYALADSFNIDEDRAVDDNVAIDVGPLLLAIENARTGLVWRLFMQHALAQRAVQRLNLSPHGT
ncbi:MAG TPA: glucoamylase family protein [Lacipirellulaceae bacterium]|nr:glucoamylase family protein [Lacipirellulaceae bacterium]